MEELTFRIEHPIMKTYLSSLLAAEIIIVLSNTEQVVRKSYH